MFSAEEIQEFMQAYSPFSPVIIKDRKHTYVKLHKFFTPEEGGAPVDLLYCCSKYGGYNTKLFVSRVIPNRQGVKWQPSVCIKDENWFHYSFQTNKGNLKQRFLDNLKEIKNEYQNRN